MWGYKSRCNDFKNDLEEQMPETVYCRHVETEKDVWVCPICKHEARTNARPGNRLCGMIQTLKSIQPSFQIQQKPRGGLPGTHLTKILESIGIFSTPICPCKAYANQMDVWGVVGCEERFDEIVQHLKDNQDQWKWSDVLTAVRKAVTTGLFLKISNPLDPFPSLVREALKRSRIDDIKHKTEGPIAVTVIVAALHNPGGIERWLIGLAKNLSAVSGGFVSIRNVVVAMRAKADPELIQELRQYTNVVLNEKGNERIVRTAVGFSDMLLVCGFGDMDDVIHDFNGPVVWCSHGSGVWATEAFDAAWKTKKVTHWTAVSQDATKIFPVSLQPSVKVIENGVEIERCVPIFGREKIRAKYGLKDDQIAVGFIGRFGNDKRPTALAEAIKNLPSKYVGVMVGGCDNQHKEEDSTIRSVKKIAGNRVIFTGRINMLGDILSALDIWFLASKSEGFCLARMEAMAAGVPVVSTPTGNLNQLETEYRNKLYWSMPVGADGSIMAAVVKSVDLGTPAANGVIRHAQRMALQRFTSVAMAGRWADYFKSVLTE